METHHDPGNNARPPGPNASSSPAAASGGEPVELTPAAELKPYQPSRRERIEELRRYLAPACAGIIVLGLASWFAWRSWHVGQTASAGHSMQTVTPPQSPPAPDTWETALQKAAQSGADLVAL